MEFIEVTKADIDFADRLMADTLDPLDELPPHTRRVLSMLDGMVAAVCSECSIDRADYRFTRREARERLGIGDTQAKIHLRRLVDAEYVIAYRAKHGRGVVYEVPRSYEADRSAASGDRSGDGRPSVGPRAAHGRGLDESHSAEKADTISAKRSGSARRINGAPEAPARRTSAARGAGR